MKIAHLIIAHKDPEHIERLAKRLASFSDVFIHIDAKSSLESFTNRKLPDNCYFCKERYSVSWGGYNLVLAEISIIRTALEKTNYDRLVLLHGADYPLQPDSVISDFYIKNKNVEFIRGCNCSESNKEYFLLKCKYIALMDYGSFLKKISLFVTKKTKMENAKWLY